MPLIPPVKIKLGGNRGAGQSYIKFATAQLSILERQMSFQNLNEGSRVVSPWEGVTVWCTSKFGKKEVHIQVDQHVTYPQVTRGKVTPMDVLHPEILPLEEIQLYYFIRIKSPDPESYPQDLDGWGGASYPEIYMDRIILCDLAFDGNVNQIDPDLDNTANRGNGFTPGGGSVAFDVDILNGVVYFPVVETEEERLRIVNKITLIAVDLPTNATPQPVGGLTDIAIDAFGFGRMSDPIQNAYIGGYDKPTTSLLYDLTYNYSVADAVWHTAIDTYPIREPENDALYSIALTAWRNQWSPLSGGNTDIYLDAYDFSGLGSVSGYYREFGFDTHIQHATYYEHVTQTANPNEYDVIVLHNNYLYDGGRNLIDGMFLAPDDVNTTAPPFFCLFASRDNSGIYATAFGGKLLSSDPDIYEVSYDYGELHATLGDVQYITDISTPLEEFTLLEIMKVSEAIDNNPPCTEAPCWFGIADSVYAWWMYNLPYGLHLLDWSPCPIPQTFFTDYGRITKTTTAYDTHRACSFHIADPNYADFNGQNNFTSFLVFSEVREKHGQGICQDYYTAPDPTDICTCSGETYTRENMPSLPYSAAGVAIYIFAPEVIYTPNTDTGVDELSWDIHTARRDPGIINPYRNLVLEEYVNTVLTDIQVFLDNATTIPKLAMGLAYTMNYYGFGITDGFAKKGPIEVRR